MSDRRSALVLDSIAGPRAGQAPDYSSYYRDVLGAPGAFHPGQEGRPLLQALSIRSVNRNLHVSLLD